MIRMPLMHRGFLQYAVKMEADQIDPWRKSGKTIAENCQMLCKPLRVDSLRRSSRFRSHALR